MSRLNIENLYQLVDTGSHYEVTAVIFEYDFFTDVRASVEAPDVVLPGGILDVFVFDTINDPLADPSSFYSVNTIFDATYLGQLSDGSVLVDGELAATTWAFFPNGVPDIANLQSDPVSSGVFLATDADFALSQKIAYTEVDTSVPLFCFAAGTLIATPDGQRAVEDLSDGDWVVTTDGRTMPVVWMGRQTVTHAFAQPDRTALVRIQSGAISPGVPSRDLTVTADHGLVIDGAIVHAAALVNGQTILRLTRSELPPVSIVYHIETPDHAVILANGCPAETFIDNASRRYFDNYAEFRDRFGDDPTPLVALDLPRAKGPRQVPVAIRRRLAGRVAQQASIRAVA